MRAQGAIRPSSRAWPILSSGQKPHHLGQAPASSTAATGTPPAGNATVEGAQSVRDHYDADIRRSYEISM